MTSLQVEDYCHHSVTCLSKHWITLGQVTHVTNLIDNTGLWEGFGAEYWYCAPVPPTADSEVHNPMNLLPNLSDRNVMMTFTMMVSPVSFDATQCCRYSLSVSCCRCSVLQLLGVPTTPEFLVLSINASCPSCWFHGSMMPLLNVATTWCCHYLMLPLLNVATTWCCHYLVLPLRGVATTWCCHYLVLPLLNVATTWCCHYLVLPLLNVATT